MTNQAMVAEPSAQADRGRHPGLPSLNVFAGGPGSLAEPLGRKGCPTTFVKGVWHRHRGSLWQKNRFSTWKSWIWSTRTRNPRNTPIAHESLEAGWFLSAPQAGGVGRRHVLPRPGPHVGRGNPGGPWELTHRGRTKDSHVWLGVRSRFRLTIIA